jgi:hypothetical protein
MGILEAEQMGDSGFYQTLLQQIEGFRQKPV